MMRSVIPDLQFIFNLSIAFSRRKTLSISTLIKFWWNRIVNLNLKFGGRGPMRNVTPNNKMLTYETLSFRSLSHYYAVLTLNKKVIIRSGTVGNELETRSRLAHLLIYSPLTQYSVKKKNLQQVELKPLDIPSPMSMHYGTLESTFRSRDTIWNRTI